MRGLKRILAVALSLAMLAAALPAFAAEPGEGDRWTYAFNEADGFYAIANPGGDALSVSSLDKIISVDGLAYKDLNGNGQLDLYEDWKLTPEERASDLTARLTADSPIEKVAPLMLASMHQRSVERPDSSDALLAKGIRHILNADGSEPTAAQVTWMNHMQAVAEADSAMFGIPVDVFSDPRSNAGATDGAYDGSSSTVSKWPGSLGFGATFNPDYVEAFGEIASKEYRALGITTALSPQIDLTTEPRWRRASGTYSESPELTADIAAAYTIGFQSTYGESGMVWGDESVAAMLKHWPGDGPGEAGRESHSNDGKYAVYPGDNFEAHVLPFATALDAENLGTTAYASAVMPSYSIGIAADGSPLGGDPAQRGSGVSPFKMAETLYGRLGFQGYVCTDWLVAGRINDLPDGGFTDSGTGMAWGTGSLPVPQRVWAGLSVGVDMYGGLESPNAVRAAYGVAVEELGQESADAHFADSARRILFSAFRLGLFEDPYRSVAESVATVGSAEFNEAGYGVQLDSVIMLKNEDGVIAPADGQAKKTVYIPLVAGRDSASLAISQASAEAVFNVVTDEYVDGAIVRRTDFTGVDFALVKVASPATGGGYAAGDRNVAGEEGYNPDEPLANGYYPKTLQYREYYADPAAVRAKPIATDPEEEAVWVAAGGEPGMSRYYGGKSTVSTNESQLDLILDTAAAIGDLPLVVAVAAQSAMVFNEFEAEAEAILVAFGTSDAAMLANVAGQHEPNGLLPVQMPADMATVERQFEDVPYDMDCHVDAAGNAYDFGYGLGWDGVIKDARVSKYAPSRLTAGEKLLIDLEATGYGEIGKYSVEKLSDYDIYHVEDATLADPAGYRPDGTLNNPSSMWMVLDGDEALFVDMGNNNAAIRGDLKQVVEAMTGDRELSIWITHLHGDHIGQRSVDIFPADTPMFVPSLEFESINGSMTAAGFTNIRPVAHGEYLPALTNYRFKYNDIIGHSVGSNGLVEEEKQILLSGDAMGSGFVWLHINRDVNTLINYADDVRALYEQIKDMDDLFIMAGHRWQHDPGGQYPGIVQGELGINYVERVIALLDAILDDNYTVNEEGTAGLGAGNMMIYLNDGLPSHGICTTQAQIDAYRDKYAVRAGLHAPKYVYTDEGSEVVYTVAAEKIRPTNMVKVTARFDARLTYANSVAADGWTFVDAPKYDPATGDYSAVIALLEKGTTFESFEGVNLIDVVFVASGIGDGTSVTGQLAAGTVYVVPAGDGVSLGVDAILDPASASTLITSIMRLDFNKDGVIGLDDLSTYIYRYYLMQAGDEGWDAADLYDLNADGRIDIVDVLIFYVHVG